MWCRSSPGLFIVVALRPRAGAPSANASATEPDDTLALFAHARRSQTVGRHTWSADFWSGWSGGVLYFAWGSFQYDLFLNRDRLSISNLGCKCVGHLVSVWGLMNLDVFQFYTFSYVHFVAVTGNVGSPSIDFSRHVVFKPKIFHGREKRQISTTLEDVRSFGLYLILYVEFFSYCANIYRRVFTLMISH